MQGQEKKDPKVQFKSFKYYEKEAGGKQIVLHLGVDQAAALIEAFKTEATDRGVKLTVNVFKNQTNDGSRQFDSASAYISGIQEPRKDGYIAGGAQKTYERKPAYVANPAAASVLNRKPLA